MGVWDDFRKDSAEDEKIDSYQRICCVLFRNDPASEECWAVAVHCLAQVQELQGEPMSCECDRVGGAVCALGGVEMGSSRNTGCLNSE